MINYLLGAVGLGLGLCLIGLIRTLFLFVHSRRQATPAQVKSNKHWEAIAQAEMDIYGHMWPNADSPFNAAAISQIRQIEEEERIAAVQARQKNIEKKKEATVVEKLRRSWGV